MQQGFIAAFYNVFSIVMGFHAGKEFLQGVS